VRRGIGALFVVGAIVGASGSEAATEQQRGRIVFSLRNYAGGERLYIVRPDGSGLRRLTRFRRGARMHFELEPAWRPDGRLIAFEAGVIRTVDISFEIWVARPDGSGLRRVIPSPAGLDTSPTWSQDGRQILFERRSRFDVDAGSSSLYVVNADGSGLHRVADGTSRHQHGPAAWAPNGKTIAFSREPADSYGNDPRPHKLFLMDPDGTNVRPLGSPQIVGFDPRWSPDGRRLAFTSERDHKGRTWTRDGFFWHNELYIVNADGSGLKRMTKTQANESGVTWSPDGKRLAFVSGLPGGIKRRYQLWTMPAAGGRATALVRTAGFASDPDWSSR
jgi:Tol biopolymer transport system component